MERLITLKETKALLGSSIKMLQIWDYEGKNKVTRIVGGRRRIPLSELQRLQGIVPQNPHLIGYARVSSATPKDDLQRQIQLLQQKGISRILTDVGSGLNEKRKNYRKRIQVIIERQVQKIVVTYPDRLIRFGFATFQ
jgi:putative resolvase